MRTVGAESRRVVKPKAELIPTGAKSIVPKSGVRRHGTAIVDITGVADAVKIMVFLVGIGNVGAIVADVTDAVRVAVGLVVIGDKHTVVA